MTRRNAERRIIGLVVSAAVACASPSAAAPRMLWPGVVSTPADEFGASETRDGKILFFNRSVPRSYTYYICWTRKRRDGAWERPQVAPFSGMWRDSDPVLSRDGKRLYFVSDRPLQSESKADFDIWYVERTTSGWSAPRNLGQPINGPGNEYFVSEAADGTLYFTAVRKGALGSIDVWSARPAPGGGYRAPENLGPAINQKGVANIEALIAPDQSFIIIGSFGRERDPGDSNLYIAVKRNGAWEKPQPLPGLINTPAREYSPRFSADGRFLLFASERGPSTEQRIRPWTYDELGKRSSGILNGLGNIYQVPLAGLGLRRVHFDDHRQGRP